MRPRCSEETKAKIAARALGRLHTPEARAKMSRSHIGKTLSAEVRAKVSAANSGANHWNWKGGVARNEAWRERHRLATRNSNRRNAERMKVSTLNYRARKRSATGTFTAQEWREKCALLGNVCIYCGEAKPLSVDHKIPLSRGGTNDIANLVPACGSCNSSKGGRTAQEFLARKAA